MDWELIKIVILVTLSIFLIIGVCMGMADVQMSLSCQRYSAMNPQHEFRYDWFIMDCFVRTDEGLWISTGQLYAKEDLIEP